MTSQPSEPHRRPQAAPVANPWPRLDEMIRSLPTLPTREQAIGLLLDNAMQLLPCHIAVSVTLEADPPCARLMTHLASIEPVWPSLSRDLQAALAASLRADVSAPELRLLSGSRRTRPTPPDIAVRTLIHMPVFTSGQIVGLLAVGSLDPQAFSDQDERILSTLATHLSLTFQQTQDQDSLRFTISELQSLNRMLTRLHGATERIIGTRGEQELYNLVLTLSIHELLADSGSVLVVDAQDPRRLRLAASRGLPDSVLSSDSFNRADGIARWVVRGGQALTLGPRIEETPFQSLAQNRHIAHALIAPLRISDRVFGALCVNRIVNPEPYSPVHREVLLLIADTAAVAIDNIRLHQRQIEDERISTIGHTALGIGHYIKNLNAILQVSRTMVDDAVAARDWRSLESSWGTIRRGVDRLSHLALDLLDYARPKEPRRESVDIHDLVCESLDEVRLTASHQGVQLEFVAGTDAPCVLADRDQIHRCLLNLLTNALDAMPEPGVVTLRTRREEDPSRPGAAWLILSVADTGTGIPEDVLPRIFLPLFSTKGSRGTGIGLAVTKKIVEEHGGRIDVETAVGQGTTFHVRLPG